MILNSYLEPSTWLSQDFDITICIEAEAERLFAACWLLAPPIHVRNVLAVVI